MTRTTSSPPSSTLTILTAFLITTVVLTGCLSDRDGEEAISALGEPFLPSAATQALRDAGYADPYLDVAATGVVHEMDLWVDEEYVLEPHEGRRVWGFAFSTTPDGPGSIPGPEIRVRQGDTVRVHLHDRAGILPGHTIHWHGVDVPWVMDGVPFLTQDVAEADEDNVYTYEFVAKQPGTYWYHCVMEFPAHIDAGMFGALVVEPQDEDADLPFDREQTLIFHETDSQVFAALGWAANPNMDPDAEDLPENPVDVVDSLKAQVRSGVDVGGGIAGSATGVYLTSEGPRDYFPMWSPRYKPNYDTFMINGKSFPNTEPVRIAEGETVRLRLINAGQLHKSIHLHGHHMLVTHMDGYPLPQPHWEDTIGLAPGERIDVYVQGTNPGIWSLHDHSGASGMGSTTTNDHAFPGGMETMLFYEDFEPPGQRAPPQGDVTAGELSVYAPIYRYR